MYNLTFNLQLTNPTRVFSAKLNIENVSEEEHDNVLIKVDDYFRKKQARNSWLFCQFIPAETRTLKSACLSLFPSTTWVIKNTDIIAKKIFITLGIVLDLITLPSRLITFIPRKIKQASDDMDVGNSRWFYEDQAITWSQTAPSGYGDDDDAQLTRGVLTVNVERYISSLGWLDIDAPTYPQKDYFLGF